MKATSGNNHLGGDDFDQRIMDWMVEEFRKEHGIDLREDRMAMQRLREAAEKAKIELSGAPADHHQPALHQRGPNGPLHLDLTLTRAQFNEMTRDLVEATLGPVRQALADAGLQPHQVDRVLLVGGSTRIPAVQEAMRDLFGKEPHKGINPDECVALGAAIQAGVLAGEVRDVVLLDVTPLSLGIETLGGVFTKLIERNTTIPTSKKQIFSTAADNQTTVEIHVLQGERPMAADNITLGRFQLTGIPPAPRGVPQIEVSFDIDANGIVNVSAKDLGTGKQQSITITSRGSLSEEEIQRMVEESQRYAEEDKKKKELAEQRNAADTLIYTVEKSLKDLGDKVRAEERERINGAIEELRKVMGQDDVEAIKAKQEALSQALYQVTTRIYQSQGPSGADGAAVRPSKPRRTRTWSMRSTRSRMSPRLDEKGA